MYGAIAKEDVVDELPNTPYEEVPDDERRLSIRPSVLVGCAGLLGVAAFAGARSLAPHTTSLLDVVGDKPDEGYSIDFEAYNSYGKNTGEDYPFIRAGKFAEPYRTTTFAAKHNVEDIDLSTCSWSFAQFYSPEDDSTDAPSDGGYYPTGLDDQYASMSGIEVEVTFASPGEYSVTLTCLDSTGKVSYGYTDTVDVYYVRRELRSLSDEDRDKYLDTFLLMSKVDTETGKKKFGRHYHDIDHFTSMHLNAAGTRSHDKIHDGTGVVTQHVSITQAIEQAMQEVDPSLTVPFWDYTIDSYNAKQKYGGLDYHLFNHELWGPKWFGNTSGTKHHITDGRWAYQKVSYKNSSCTDCVASPYGYMRAPWNLNPSPFVTRYHKMCGVGPEKMYMGGLKDLTDYKWPTCASHWKLTFAYDNWYDWVWDSSYSPHGPVHSWIGGFGGSAATGGCDDAFNVLTERGLMNETYSTRLKMNMFGTLKNAWRERYIEAPSWCSMDSSDSCVFKCAAKMNGDGGLLDYMATVAEMYELPYSDWTDADYMFVAEVLFCGSSYWPGDHLEAASPVEASFWPIHPTLDRLLQHKILKQPFADKSWEASDGDTEYCTYSSDSACKGHHAYDLTFWEVVTKESSGYYTKSYLSNQEIREAVNPSSYKMSYIYDNFKWDHCEADGYNMTDGSSWDHVGKDVNDERRLTIQQRRFGMSKTW